MKKLSLVLAAAAASVLVDVRPADACGGCFIPQSEQTVVTDHRMVLSISKQQTVLWDQIRYSGDPREFAWVLPVRAGAKIEVANDELFAALDASTQPTIYAPNTFGGNVGCGLTGCSESSASSAEAAGPGDVQVLSQAVIGPYETVTLRATDDDALTAWLTKNDYAIPPSIEPTIKAYVDERFDFIALKLRPQCSERSMRPVRVITSGADATLPLRMVAAGIGARVGITLWVIAEGRWEPQNFPNALFDDDQLRWNRLQNSSNYEALSQAAMAEGNGRTWLTESSDRAQLPPGIWSGRSFRGNPTPELADAYFGQCPAFRGSSSSSSSSSGSSGTSSGGFTPCPKPSDPNVSDSGQQQPEEDASKPDAGDAGQSDAGESDAGGDGENDGGGLDASSGETPGTKDASTPTRTGSVIAPNGCYELDDLDVALSGMARSDVWVTRLRAVLPVDALSAGDLRLQASKSQTTVSNLHYATYFDDEDAPTRGGRGGCGSAPKEHRAYGSWVLGVLSALSAVAFVRRKRRK